MTVPTRNGEPDATIEISPLFAVSERHLKNRKLNLGKISPGAKLYFGEKGLENA